MRRIVLLLLLCPLPALAADPMDRNLLFHGWLMQGVAWNQLKEGVPDAFHTIDLLPLQGNGNDVRVGMTGLGLGLRSKFARKFESHLLATIASSGVTEPEFTWKLREAWLGYKREDNALSLRLGQYTVPMGLEQPDSPNRWFVTNGLVSSFLVPTNLAGFIAGAQAGRALRFRLWFGGPWNDQTYLITSAPNIGTRLNIKAGKQINLGLYMQYGDSNPDKGFYQRIVSGIDAYVTPLDSLTLAAEFLLYANRHETPREAFYLYSWASMGMIGWNLQEWLRWGIRLEYVADDARNQVSNLFVLSQQGLEQARAEYATVMDFYVPGNVVLKLEGRYDHSSLALFRRAREKQHGYWSANLQVIYEFEK